VRPEASDGGGYDSIPPRDDDDWQAFTAWRPSDRSNTPRTAPSGAVGRDLTETGYYSRDRFNRPQEGDRVSATRAVGEGILPSVPRGTMGEIREVRDGLLERRYEVQFRNGYTETVRESEIKFESRGFFQ
jgi:hypothetical protein